MLTLIPSDCRAAMLDMALSGETFDSIVCDPPYDLTSVVKRFGRPGSAPAQYGHDGAFARQSRGFMGKTWDGTGVAFDPETWRAAYEVLKPGAYLAAFGGTRTYHRMACAIEDAGFEIRDCLQWLYGTGFPKSRDVSKAIDKASGATRSTTGPARYGDGHVQINTSGGAVSGYGGGLTAEGAGIRMATAPATAEAALWSGWGTALKPAVELICLARKPLVGTVLENVRAHGTGAINIDGCRVPLSFDDVLQDGIAGRDGAPLAEDSGWGFRAVDREAGLGRWPANVVHDGSEEVRALFPDARGQIAPVWRDGTAQNNAIYGARRHSSDTDPTPRGDAGSAARFFYCAKAGKTDRAGSKHPTVKPIALMRWLCRLVTPPGGRIFDPFGGSGTTLAAAHAEGFSAVACEMESDYQDDIRRRIAALADDGLADFLSR